MAIAVQIGLNALIAGALYALVALGFNLIYSTVRFFDVGYGGVAVAGAYAVFYFYRSLDWPLAVSIILGVLLAGCLGWLIEKILYRRLRQRKASKTVLLVASIGVLTVTQALIAIFFTSEFQSLTRDIGNISVFQIAGGAITETQVLIVAVVCFVALGIGMLLRFTRFGIAVRAVADDEEVARIVGIPSERLIGMIFFLGSCIGAIAAIGTGFDSGIEPTAGLTLLLGGVIAAIIGGVGNIWGGVVGAFLLALIENIGVWQFSGEWKTTIAFVVLTLILVFKPRGLFER